MAIPTLTPVTSSNIAAVGHDGDALWIRFHGGRLYRYPGVGREHHEGLIASDSPGRYLVDRVRHFAKAERVE
jgi:hypothetical protein